MDIVFIIIISIYIIWVLLSVIVLFNNYLYNAVFNRKERKTWEFLIRNADKFGYIGDHKICKAFRWGDYVAIIWIDNTCSIYLNAPTRKECLLSPFDKVMSNKMIDLLLTKIK